MQKILKKLDWLFPLIARITVGIVFVQSGWGKLHSIGKVTAYFTQLGIPYPMAQAYFVGVVELICGGLLVLGLFTRLTVVPLIAIMVVALLTAKKSEIAVYTDLFGLSEYLYIVLLGWLGVMGAGAISVDKIFKRA